MYKGRCATLSRDLELHQGFMMKANSEVAGSTEQFSYMKERVKLLEGDLETAIRQKTDA